MTKRRNWREFEKAINKCCIKYRKAGLAVIQQIATPVSGNIMRISTIDFHGCYQKNGLAVPIAIEAKVTKSKSSFSCSNIRDHQISFLRLWSNVGGEAFLFIHFSSLQEPNNFYKTPIKFILPYWDAQYTGNSKSIKINQFKSEWLCDTSDFLNLL